MRHHSNSSHPTVLAQPKHQGLLAAQGDASRQQGDAVPWCFARYSPETPAHSYLSFLPSFCILSRLGGSLPPLPATLVLSFPIRLQPTCDRLSSITSSLNLSAALDMSPGPSGMANSREICTCHTQGRAGHTRVVSKNASKRHRTGTMGRGRRVKCCTCWPCGRTAAIAPRSPLKLPFPCPPQAALPLSP